MRGFPRARSWRRLVMPLVLLPACNPKPPQHSKSKDLMETPPVGQSSLSDVETLLRSNGKVASVSESFTVTFDQVLEAVQGCEGTLRRTAIGPPFNEVVTIALSLSRLSPNAQISQWERQDLYSVRINTANGQQDLTTTVKPAAGRGSKDHKVDFFELIFPNRQLAETAAVMLKSAIQGCGGRERSPQAVATANARDSVKDAKTAFVLNGHLSPEDKEKVVKDCEDRVRPHLKSPTTALFPKPPQINGNPADSSLLLTGKAEAQNSYGGYGSINYMCTMKRFGQQYIPGHVSVF
jgi:hypothetical protein